MQTIHTKTERLNRVRELAGQPGAMALDFAGHVYVARWDRNHVNADGSRGAARVGRWDARTADRVEAGDGPWAPRTLTSFELSFVGWVATLDTMKKAKRSARSRNARAWREG